MAKPQGHFDPNEHQHIRYNPLRDEWILVSPHRMNRPWAGQTEATNDQHQTPGFDPTNPLCPGVMRASGVRTPQYTSTYVFSNDFPALLETTPTPSTAGEDGDDELFRCRSAQGECRVMCFHPQSNVYLPTMLPEEIVHIIDEWQRQTKELGERYTWVQIFENRGAMMGCSNPHPHCQIWASSFLPNEARIKDARLVAYHLKHQRPLLIDYLHKELNKRERIVVETEHWVVLVPYWAVWPFETMVLPKQQIQRFTDVTQAQKQDLAHVLKVLVSKYDNLFKCSFPYSMGWHGAPTGERLGDAPSWTFHGIYLPPLLRSASVRKFIVGYELLAQSQRDLTPEKAAQLLREQSETHYTLAM